MILEALKARNEVAASGSRKTNPLVSFRAFGAFKAISGSIREPLAESFSP